MAELAEERKLLERLVLLPSETLYAEYKFWLDPSQNLDAAKIVRACLALRNRNGGHLIIGFKDQPLEPDKGGAPNDIRARYHSDKIQDLVSKYASKPFEVRVEFVEHEGTPYPIVIVPPGVLVPVVAKADLLEQPSSGDKLITFGAVYFRTLRANGRVSTSIAQPEDWEEIIEICITNKEGDVAKFLRTHFPGFPNALGLAAAQSTPPSQNLRHQADEILQAARDRFFQVISGRDDERRLENLGTWTVVLVVHPQKADVVPDREFLDTLDRSNPDYTGWPIWMDTRAFREEGAKPRVVDGTYWEAFVSDYADGVDYMRLDPRGQFVLVRTLQDDTTDKVAPGTALDPVLAILRVAEAIAVGLAFVKALGWELETTKLGFSFEWTKLKGRELRAWAGPGFRPPLGGGTAYDDKAGSFVEVPADTPVTAIAPFVDQATRPLFACFEGYTFPRQSLENWVDKLIERKLS